MKPSPITEHDHASGPADAALTLVEYGDYECPMCVKAYPVLDAICKAFSGRLRFVYRHVPKSSQGFLKQAAQASEFAASQGKFWQMHAQLFALAGEHDLEHLVGAAKAIGLDPDACRKALVEHTFAERVRELSVASVQSGIIGTPTLFINGIRYENRIEEPLLKSELNKLLLDPSTQAR
ncbi:MAG: thioredoxin domain-containing protein [Polyangiaceae bacterium]